MILEFFDFSNIDFNIVQGLGFVAFFVGIYAFSRAQDNKLRIWQAAQNFILALHFYLLGSESAAAITITSNWSHLRNSMCPVRQTPLMGIFALLERLSERTVSLTFGNRTTRVFPFI
jgi:IS1 family transposase